MKLAHIVAVLTMLSASLTIRAELPLPMTKVAEIRRLSRQQAGQGIPVKITGVCISCFHVANLPAFVINDGQESIWVQVPSKALDSPEIRRGSQLVVEGVTDPAAYGPAIIAKSVQRVGESPLPSPKHPALESLLSGNEDCQWIEVEGVVQAAYQQGPHGLGALLLLDGIPCRLGSAGVPRDFGKLVDARIRVRGIFSPDVNSRSEAALLKILVADPKTDIDVVEPAPKDPFQSPQVPLERLMPFSPDSRPWHRRVVSGVVTYTVSKRFFFLQDGETGLRVDSPAEVQVGQQVDVAGFVDTSHTFASLRNAVVRVTGAGMMPSAIPVTAPQLLDPGKRSDWGKPQSSDFGGRWVRLSGIVVRVDRKSSRDPLTLLVESDKIFFLAEIPNNMSVTERQVANWKPGALVDLTGVCEYEFPEKGDPVFNYVPKGFHLWLKGPEGVTVIKSAPWWTTGRLLSALGGVLVAMSLVMFWSFALRRQVQKQIGIISSKSRLAATEGERVRIARDLHDDIGAGLAQIGLLGSLAQRPANSPERARVLLKQITGKASEMVTALDEIVWAVNPKHDSTKSLSSYFCDYAQEFLRPSPIACRLDVANDLPDLPLESHARHQLFLAFKEALTNVVRHAQATAVTVIIDAVENELRVAVEDNGRGFHEGFQGPTADGLQNMAGRLKSIGGRCEWMNQPSGGARVSLVLPLKAGGAQQ
ncbi:MAG: sensor histidine kinase [Verrucomicrobiota bacterium]